MHKYLLLSALLVLSACSFGKTDTTNPTPNTPDAPVTSTEMPKNAVVSLNYTLREGSPTGKILETTVESIAKENGLYTDGATYKPFEVILGTNSVIPGFENGIATMKKGEKKMIEVLPKDGYGEASVQKTVRESEIAAKFTITADRSRFEDTVTETVQRNMLGAEGENLTVGKVLTGGANVVAKVTKIDGDTITLSIENKDNPFYGKKLAKGVSVKNQGVTFTVKDLDEKKVTLDIENSNSPFFGKDFVVGATANMPTLAGAQSPGMIKVLAISGEMVDLEIPNNHPLGGKTLYFDVEIVDIK
jgi:FKBP-type peptidyl-prolyl cis-trans isomerase 2